ncbi:MAG: CapA family protein [Spirochaetaceae bacterium]|nr:CapA family protein [Spirochaetaceae bacterium]
MISKTKYLLISVSLFLFFSCSTTRNITDRTSIDQEKFPTNEITIIAVGDNLIHIDLIKSAKDENTNLYSFDQYYTESEIASVIQNADIAFINQETLTAGEEFGYSGYPAFNGPKDIADTLVRLGFDVVNHATNHSMDKGERALFEDMKNWEKYQDVKVLGVYASQDERDNKKNIITKNNITVGFLSYTYGLNGISLPKDKPYLVSLIDKKIMDKEITELRPLCDVLVVSMHWGNEYEHIPSKTQEDLATFLADHNVDLVIGHHPHVLQPARYISRKDGGTMLCFFSLGNFLSSQRENYTLLGGMMFVTIKKEDNSIIFNNAELIPLVTHYTRDKKIFRVYLLSEYTHDLALKHGAANSKNTINPEYFDTLVKTVFKNGLDIKNEN